MGLLFAFPVSAATLYSGPWYTSFSTWLIQSHQSGASAFVPQGSTAIPTSTALIVTVEACVSGAHEARTLDLYSDWVDSGNHGPLVGTATITTACDEDYWEFWQNVSIPVDAPFGGSHNLAFLQREDYENPNTQIALNSIVQVTGGVTDTPYYPGDVAIPSSTYQSSALSRAIPTFSFSTETARASSTAWQHRADVFFGSASSTFPTCFAYPWFELLDLFQSGIATGTPQTFTIGGTSVVPTSTWSLGFAPGVMASTGSANAVTSVFEMVQWALWMFFGWNVLTVLFFRQGQVDET